MKGAPKQFTVWRREAREQRVQKWRIFAIRAISSNTDPWPSRRNAKGGRWMT
jgi:hypothetical protein